MAQALMSKRMSPAHYWLCRAILLMDKLPIPHRYYVLHRMGDPPKAHTGKAQGPFWSCKPGHRGTQFLIDRKWLFRFAHEYEFRVTVKRSNGQGSSS